MAIRICPECGGKVSTTRNDCIHCGYVFPVKKVCPECGEELDMDIKECESCGYIFYHEQKRNNKQVNIQAKVDRLESVEDKPQIINKELTEKVEQSVVVAPAVPIVQPVKLDKQPVPVVKVVEPIENIERHEPVAEEIEPVKKTESVVEIVEQVDEVKQSETVVEVVEPIEEIEVVQEVIQKAFNDSAKCPYCGSSEHMEIGKDFYLCTTCKSKFLDIIGTHDSRKNLTQATASIKTAPMLPNAQGRENIAIASIVQNVQVSENIEIKTISKEGTTDKVELKKQENKNDEIVPIVSSVQKDNVGITFDCQLQKEEKIIANQTKMREEVKVEKIQKKKRIGKIEAVWISTCVAVCVAIVCIIVTFV